MTQRARTASTRAPHPEQAAPRKRRRSHADTPTVAHFDSLGRPFLTVAHNRFKRANATIAQQRNSTTPASSFDIEGNQREVIDAKDRIVMRYDYDMLGNRIHQASMEAGERWMLNDVAGKPIYAWDSRGHHSALTTIRCVAPRTLSPARTKPNRNF